MTNAGNKPEILRYDAAHAFANERSPAYDAACGQGVGAHDGVPGRQPLNGWERATPGVVFGATDASSASAS